MSRLPVSSRTILQAAWLVALFAISRVSPAQDGVVYKPVTTLAKPPVTNQFEIFSPTNIPNRRNDERGAFRTRLAYSSRDWEGIPEPPSRRQIPVDPSQIQHTLLGHRTVPAVLAITFERVEAKADSDPVTLTKILRYSREANAKFRVLSETNRSIGGVEGMETEYIQLRRGRLMRVRHWITHYNGVACQLQLIAPYANPELMQIGGPAGFPLLVEFLDPERKRPVIKDAEVPRKFESPYGYRVDLGAGEWIPGVIDPYIPSAEYAAYTRNQGGIAVVPLSTFGQNLDTTPLLDTMLAVGEVPLDRVIGQPQRHGAGELSGLTLETLSGDEEETIRMRVKAVRTPAHGYLAVAWINTNAQVAPNVLDQWLDKITFIPNAAPYPTNAGALGSFRERDRHASAFMLLGQHYLAKGDFDRSAEALRTAMEARFLPAIFMDYVTAEHRRGHPEEIVQYVKSRGPLALAQGWVAMEFAFAESKCGHYDNALVYYTKCFASGGYSEATFPARHFEDYIRCLAKDGRTKWATDRLQQRIRDDNSPVWPQMLEQVKQNTLPLPSAPSALGSASVKNSAANNSPAPAQPAKPPPVETGVPKLKGIVWNPSNPSAQLDSRLVFKGDTVRGYKVTKIQKDNVDLIAPDGTKLTVNLTPRGD